MKSILLSDSDLLLQTKVAAQNEKSATLELLQYLKQVDERRAYATLACSSLFDYVVRILGYSEAQASERVNSVRLIRSIPAVEAKLKSGDLSMSTASQVQRFLRQEKSVGNGLDRSQAAQVIETCSGHSKREVEKILFGFSSQEARIESAERVRVLSLEHTELKFAVQERTLQKLNELKDLLGNQSLSAIFDQALESLLTQVKKKKGVATTRLTKTESATLSANQSVGHSSSAVSKTNTHVGPPVIEDEDQNSRYLPMSVKREVSVRSGNQCEYTDPKTGERCRSRYRLEFDHFPIPYANGGKNTVSNLRHACFQHNQRHAMDAARTRGGVLH